MIKHWLDEVNRKQGVRLLIKNSRFSFLLKTEESELLVKIENGYACLSEDDKNTSLLKRMDVRSDVLQSILTGERKLRETVKHNEASAKMTFRELLLLESLFYLAKSDKTHPIYEN